jgi:hypothetical protein
MGRREERAVEVGRSTGRSEEQESKQRRVRHVVGEGRSSERSEARRQDGTDNCAQALPFELRHSFSFFPNVHTTETKLFTEIFTAQEKGSK